MLRAVRQAKGVRKRRLLRERRAMQEVTLRERAQRDELRQAIAVLNAAYGRPR